MARPQQPELARSAKTDLDPDHIETGLQGQQKPKAEGATGPVPPENEPGHHPPKEQDKPDLDAFAARLGTDPKAPAATSARKAPRPKAESTKTGPAKKTASAKKTAPAKKAAKAGSSKAASRPAAPPKRSAAPTPKEAAQFSAPQPEPDAGREPRLVGLMLLPLRETVKRLEQLDRTLTKRLAGKRRAG
jgi:hypothetical protein